MGTNTLPVLTGEDLEFQYFETKVNGWVIRSRRKKSNGEVMVDADFFLQQINENRNAKTILGSDEGLDFLSEIKKAHPELNLNDLIKS